MLTQTKLKEVLHYDPLTGIFTWLKRTSIRVKVGDVAGYINGVGYWTIGLFGKEYRAHRLAFLYMTGTWPKDEVDHKDLNPLNNSWRNIREANRSQNAFNQGVRINNTSSVKGVYWNKQRGKYQAQATVSNKTIALGRYETLEEAEKAYFNFVTPIHGVFINTTKKELPK